VYLRRSPITVHWQLTPTSDLRSIASFTPLPREMSLCLSHWACPVGWRTAYATWAFRLHVQSSAFDARPCPPSPELPAPSLGSRARAASAPKPSSPGPTFAPNSTTPSPTTSPSPPGVSLTPEKFKSGVQKCTEVHGGVLSPVPDPGSLPDLRSPPSKPHPILAGPDLFAVTARQARCPSEQSDNFIRAGVILQPRHLLASAAARLDTLAKAFRLFPFVRGSSKTVAFRTGFGLVSVHKRDSGRASQCSQDSERVGGNEEALGRRSVAAGLKPSQGLRRASSDAPTVLVEKKRGGLAASAFRALQDARWSPPVTAHPKNCRFSSSNVTKCHEM
jgi:hypothetical protein